MEVLGQGVPLEEAKHAIAGGDAEKVEPEPYGRHHLEMLGSTWASPEPSGRRLVEAEAQA